LSNTQNNIESIITQLSADGWANDRDDQTELYKEARLQILHDLKKLSSYLTATLVALSSEESGSKVENYYGDDEF
jgi:Fe-S cluster biosynthesis and repair protein YggX